MIDKPSLLHTWQHYKTPIIAVAIYTWLSMAAIKVHIDCTDSIAFPYLMPNLLLAWIPLWASFVLNSIQGKGIGTTFVYCAIFCLWFVFFPNAPYILGNFVHLRSSPLNPLWYDIVLLSIAAWTSLLLGFVSLRQVQESVQKRVGTRAGWVVVLGVLVASSFGIYLGRFQWRKRWGFTSVPDIIFADIANNGFTAFTYSGAIVITSVFSVCLFMAYSALWWYWGNIQHNRGKL